MLLNSAFISLFLSTPSARRATYKRWLRDVLVSISIHALREEGDRFFKLSVKLSDISIHALREEGDTMTYDEDHVPYGISIHALREEGDYIFGQEYTIAKDFYPRPPRGGRRPDRRQFDHQREISIHALREEGDLVDSLAR